MNTALKLPWLPPPGKFLGFIGGVTASIFWGYHPVLIRYLTSEGVSPLSIASLRLLIGSSLLALFIFVSGLFTKRVFQTAVDKKSFQYTKYFWFGVLGLTANFLLFHLGLKYTIASNAILLEAFAPVVVLILVILFLPRRLGAMARNPRMLRYILLVVIAGSIGSSLLVVNQPKNLPLGPSLKFLGDLIEFGAMFFFALYFLSAHEYQQRSSGYPPLKITAHYLFFSGLLIAPFVPWRELQMYTANQWVWIITLSALSTSLAYGLWQKAAKYLDVIPLALLFGLSSIFNVAIESFVFQLDLSPALLLGTVLILASSIASQWLISRYKISSAGEAVIEG